MSDPADVMRKVSIALDGIADQIDKYLEVEAGEASRARTGVRVAVRIKNKGII